MIRPSVRLQVFLVIAVLPSSLVIAGLPRHVNTAPAYLSLSSLLGKSARQVCRASLPGKSAGQVCRASLPGKSAGQVCRASLNMTKYVFVHV
jgi:hypothetical protein